MSRRERPPYAWTPGIPLERRIPCGTSPLNRRRRIRRIFLFVAQDAADEVPQLTKTRVLTRKAPGGDAYWTYVSLPGTQRIRFRTHKKRVLMRKARDADVYWSTLDIAERSASGSASH